MGKKKWYYRFEERSVGPFSSKELRAAVLSGEINQDTFLWKRGLKRWVRASRVVGLCEVPVQAVAEPRAKPFRFQPVPIQAEDGFAQHQAPRSAGVQLCMQCQVPMPPGADARCASCENQGNEFHLDVAHKVGFLVIVLWGLIGLAAFL